MTKHAIIIENISKLYRIGSKERSYDTLIGKFNSFLMSPFTNLNQLRRLKHFKNGSNDSSDVIWALKDLSAEIEENEVMGIIGKNGSGKSTLLKILSKITEPTSGRAFLNGRVASLLEVGTGFHPELTGRENIYLNGTVLGMHKTEVDRKFDEIVDFSGVEKFLDTPIKRYSSGMQVRLAFSVAAHLEPDILIIDEVLAVGDAVFQKKCLGKIESIASTGRTVLFVSHNMEAVSNLCNRVIWINDGKKKMEGMARDVVQSYLESSSEKEFYFEDREHGLVIEKVILKNSKGENTSQFRTSEDLLIEIYFQANRKLEKPYILIIVKGHNGTCFTASMLLDGHRPDFLNGGGIIKCRFKSIPLLPQRFTLQMEIRSKNGRDPILKQQDIATFQVNADLKKYGYSGEFLEHAKYKSNPVVVPYEWILPDGTVASVGLTNF